MTGLGVVNAICDRLGLRRARGAAAVRERPTREYAAELRVGASTRHLVVTAAEDATVVAMDVRRAHGATAVYLYERGELVALATKGATGNE